jgi:hypothetical protein
MYGDRSRGQVVSEAVWGQVEPIWGQVKGCISQQFGDKWFWGQVDFAVVWGQVNSRIQNSPVPAVLWNHVENLPGRAPCWQICHSRALGGFRAQECLPNLVRGKFVAGGLVSVPGRGTQRPVSFIPSPRLPTSSFRGFWGG